MPKKLTQQEFEQRVFDAVGDIYEVVSEYQGKSKPVTLRCKKHNINFTVSAECFMRGKGDIRSSCPQCAEEAKNERLKEHRVEVVCSYCGKTFTRQKSDLNNSKSGLYFCCREHKDLAQRVESNIPEIWPEHYQSLSNLTISTYRKKAFICYPHKCAICGWDEDKDILEVHHIDENRSHNDLENLIILCPICHRKLTSHKYKLINREQIVLC